MEKPIPDALEGAGAPFTGEIAYEVPQGAKDLQLLFSGLLSENKLVFDLGE